MTGPRVTHVPVLIVGGGLVGLSAAVFLSRLGVSCTLVERRPTTSVHPRARGVNPRTMEIFRACGLEEEIRNTGSARALAGNDGVVVVDSLAGDQLGTFERGYQMAIRADIAALSPSGWCLCDQNELEPILRAAATETGADLRFGFTLRSWTQDTGGVDAWVRDRTGRDRLIRADYLIAADGAASGIRSGLDIGMSGRGTLGHYVNIYFSANLRRLLGERRFLLCYVVNAHVVGALLPVDNAERWLLHVPYDPSQSDVPGDFPPQRCADLVRAAAGDPDLAVDIIEVLPWEAAGRTADRFAAGRMFLAGDAAHVMPPTGAFGSNAGIQDVHNLAWKLSAVCSGAAGPKLLDTYEDERLPVARLTVQQAVLRSKDRRRRTRARSSPAGLVPDEAVIFGGRYGSAFPPGEALGADRLTGVPGTRVPHVPFHRDGSCLSSLDLVTDGMVLFCGSGRPWRDAALRAARRLPVAVEVYEIGPGGDLRDGDPAWSDACGVTAAGAVLVRPDGYVGWRSEGAAADPARTIEQALRDLLRR